MRNLPVSGKIYIVKKPSTENITDTTLQKDKPAQPPVAKFFGSCKNLDLAIMKKTREIFEEGVEMKQSFDFFSSFVSNMRILVNNI